MSLLLLALLQGTAALPIDFDLARLPDRDRLALRARCDAATSTSDIIVCGSRHPAPIPNGWIDDDPDKPDDARVTRGTGAAALTASGACGMFAGERDCSKAEMQHSGYGRGRDPITFFKKLATKLIDPDAN